MPQGFTSLPDGASYHPKPQDSPALGLVVLLPWMFAPKEAVSKYIQLVHQQGWDVLLSTAELMNLWLPSQARSHAAKLGQALEDHLFSRPRPVVVAVFSGQVKSVYWALLEYLDGPQVFQPTFGSTEASETRSGSSNNTDQSSQQQRWSVFVETVMLPALPPQPVLQQPTPDPLAQQSSTFTTRISAAGRRLLSHVNLWRSRDTQVHRHIKFPVLKKCLCGHWLDSPADFTSETGCRMLAPASSSALRQHLVTAAGCTADFFLLEVFESQRAALWARLALGHTATSVPTLLCYSWNDELADAHRVHGLAQMLRWMGSDVVEMAWDTSEHCAHLRHHPKDYMAALQLLLNKAQATFARAQQAPVQSGGETRSSQPCNGIASPTPVPSRAAGCDAWQGSQLAAPRSRL